MKKQERLDEVFRRAENIRRKQDKKRIAVLGGTGAALTVCLILVIGAVPRQGTAKPEATALGAFLLGPETGGYVIVALLAFILGIIVSGVTRSIRETGEKRTDDKRRK